MTGAGRPPGRGFATRFTRDGAAVIAVDHDAPEPSGPADLAATVAAVETAGGRICASSADARDPKALAAAVAAGTRRFGRLDAVVVGPVVTAPGSITGTPDDAWHDTLDRVLTTAWTTCRVALAHLVDGGSITVVASAAGLRGFAHLAPHAAAEHGVVGLVRSLAHELAPRSIRVNSVHPTDDGRASLPEPSGRLVFDPEADVPVPFAAARDVSETVLYLASDDARMLSGLTVPVGAELVSR
ncbi:SDR family oxidoreductase [Pseudonocardia sp. N23]|uniref:SDR family oxidoreductase n=1 Tax=Pseudonocardia sp. N23 TaxID=1987376 RepID=UPI000C0376A7|nr:SDR family oxidoreductase [Pseudonocardia sp. N23]GAY07233.1 short-chain dehydrogenase [Pseudonocardia sp. N23]